MFFLSIIFLIILISSIQSLKPTLKLTFTPDEKYFTIGHQVEIFCELMNPSESTESPQLWHVDIRTGKHTTILRSLLNQPPDDSPDVFKQNRFKRLEYVKRNHIRIKSLQLDDTARYECNCPDCEEPLGKLQKELNVMKLSEPKWHIEPHWPILEHVKTTIKCTVDDFYPYVTHKIIHRHHDITNEGKSVVPNSNTYPQKFSWEATITPTADWHNTTLQCVVIQGNSDLYTTKRLEIIFTPRFLRCNESQHVDSSKKKATIECSYSGNPQPKLTWFRQTDEKPITSDVGITIETKDEHHGKYRSIVTFDRDKLITIPLTKTTGDNYYQQLLNGGFIAKLTYNNEHKGLREINIIDVANQERSEILNNSSIKTIQNLSTAIFLFSFLIMLYIHA